MVYVKKPDPDVPDGWKPKARTVACGNFEEGSWSKEIGNRAEVPDTFMMRSLIAEASVKGWSVGAADFSTAFLNALLSDEDDGIYIVKPPNFLVKLGIEEEGIYWKLTKAMNGLRKARKWEEARDACMKRCKLNKPKRDNKY